ncbi:MAG: hypothetical protein HYR96_00885 [Deltaproteobacteria bacterium]|nr:hypothetical protein [Deltaproteobacteria bacterium]MBI3296077.1 hypothetical protein [Deltaproteobacteria bacterium]
MKYWLTCVVLSIVLGSAVMARTDGVLNTHSGGGLRLGYRIHETRPANTGATKAEKKSDYVNVTLEREAAEGVYKGLSSKEETTKRGARSITTKRGDSITCTFEAEVESRYQCTFRVDKSNGKIDNQCH